MTRTLSSAQTFFMKVIVPVVWITLFSMGTLLLFASPAASEARAGGLPDGTMKWIFLVATIAGTAFMYWACIRLKRVALDGDSLLVSNYLREVRIPLGEIEDVTENRWVNIHPVTIHFRHETEFGNSVVFMPRARFFGFLSAHPVVEELLTAARRFGTLRF